MVFYITMFVVWSLVAIIAMVIEIHTVQQIGFACSIAAIVAIIVHALKADAIWPEFVAFGVTWIISWLILFALMFKYKKQIHDKEDGYLDFIDKEIVAEIGNETGFGRASFGDKSFRFKSDSKIEKGDVIVVESIKGATLIVNKKI